MLTFYLIAARLGCDFCNFPIQATYCQALNAQVIDDTIGHTLAAVSSLTKKVAAEGQEEGQEGSQETFLGANKEAAELVGKKLAELCLAKDIKRVFFDRGGFRYHGRIQVTLRLYSEKHFKIGITAFSYHRKRFSLKARLLCKLSIGETC